MLAAPQRRHLITMIILSRIKTKANSHGTRRKINIHEFVEIKKLLVINNNTSDLPRPAPPVGISKKPTTLSSDTNQSIGCRGAVRGISNRTTRLKINHIAISNRSELSLQDVRIKRGVDLSIYKKKCCQPETNRQPMSQAHTAHPNN